MSVILGKDIETGTSVKIDDIARYGGLYILGKTGTGKSNLLVSLALQDIEQGNGLLFIDPHKDAIEDILARVPKKRIKDVILLDPTDPDYAFGINPLYCTNPQDPGERERAFGQVRDIFAKLAMSFGEPDEKLGVLLNKYLRNILYPLIENPGSTLYDITMMLTNKTFREHLLSNVKYSLDTVDFWHYQFDPLSKHDQYEELKSTFNRISLFQRHYIRDIIAQPKSTLDFTEIMRSRKIILLKMPISHDEEIRSFTGMLVISQLLKVIFLRADISEQQRVPFAIYCDEFHNFATPDFARLFAQTRKFKVMPVVAHQHRDQFKPGDPNKGATLASPNKVHFNLNKEDADEFAIEVAKKPPTEIKRERELVISQSPVEDLLQGHANPEIRRFVNRYLRPMQERTEDIKEEMEGGKLIKMGLQDEAAISRFEAQAEKYRFEDSMTRVRESLARSFYKTTILQDLHTRSWNLKQTTRGFNYFLTSVMEGYIKPGSETFANFLIERMRDLPQISKEHAKVIELFIQLLYGDPHAPRVIPFSLAQAHGLFRSDVALLTESAEKKTSRERQEFAEKYIKNEWDHFNKNHVEKKDKIKASMLPHRQNHSWEDQPPFLDENIFRNAGWDNRNWREFYGIWMPDNVYSLFIWLLAYPRLWDIVSPYTTARFVSGSKWKKLVNSIDKLIFRICWSFDPGFKSQRIYDGEKTACRCGYSYCGTDASKANCVEYANWVFQRTHHYEEYVKDNIVYTLKEFLKKYKEGAFVILALMYMARKGWRKEDGILPLPDMEGKDPLEVLQVFKKLNDFMQSNLNYDVLLSYFEENKILSTVEKWKYNHSLFGYVKQSKEEFLSKLCGHEYFDGGFTLEVGKIELPPETLECVRFPKTTVTNRWEWFAEHYEEAANQWTRVDDLTRSYLLTRAFYIVYHDLDISSNAPTLERALVCLLKDTEARLVEKLQREKDAELMKIRREQEQRERERIEKECAREIAKIYYPPPDNLNSRVLKNTEIEELKKACLNKLDPHAKATLMVIDDFVNFCTLLSKPENHIKKPSGQYVEKEVPLRTVADMVNEMRGELTDLPNFTAYAKIMQVENGNQSVVKHKIATFTLPEKLPNSNIAESQQDILNQTHQNYCQKREIIENQIRERQKAWQRDLNAEPLNVHRR